MIQQLNSVDQLLLFISYCAPAYAGLAQQRSHRVGPEAIEQQSSSQAGGGGGARPAARPAAAASRSLWPPPRVLMHAFCYLRETDPLDRGHHSHYKPGTQKCAEFPVGGRSTLK
jgi:hypothetical protein